MHFQPIKTAFFRLMRQKGVVYGRNLPSENKKPSFAALGGILQGVPCQNMPDMLQ